MYKSELVNLHSIKWEITRNFPLFWMTQPKSRSFSFFIGLSAKKRTFYRIFSTSSLALKSSQYYLLRNSRILNCINFVTEFHSNPTVFFKIMKNLKSAFVIGANMWKNKPNVTDWVTKWIFSTSSLAWKESVPKCLINFDEPKGGIDNYFFKNWF
jgi:hypothetical protein